MEGAIIRKARGPAVVLLLALLVAAFVGGRQPSAPPTTAVSIASPVPVDRSTKGALEEGHDENLGAAVAMAAIAGFMLVVVVVVAVGRRRALVTAPATVTIGEGRRLVRARRPELELDPAHR